MDVQKNTMDGLWQSVIGVSLLLIGVVSCSSCSVFGSKPPPTPAQLVQDLAKNCKKDSGMSEADVDIEKDGDVQVHVGCHPPAARLR
jgi:hypothetical protein